MSVPTIQEVPTYDTLASLPDGVGTQFQAVVTSARMYQELVQAGRDDTFVCALEDVVFRQDTEKLETWLTVSHKKYAASLTDVLLPTDLKNEETLFHAYFGGIEPTEMMEIGRLTQRLPYLLDEAAVESNNPADRKAYVEAEISTYSLSPDMIHNVMVYQFHLYFLKRKFDKARGVQELADLRLGSIYQPILDTCKLWSSSSSIRVGDEKCVIFPLSEVSAITLQSGNASLLPLNVSVALEAYLHYGLSIPTLKSLGIPSAAWQVAAMILHSNIHHERSTEKVDTFAVIEQIISPEQMRAAMEETYKRTALSARHSAATQLGHERIARTGKFESEESLKKQLIIEGLREKLKSDFRTEIELIWDACAFYKIPLEAVFDDDMIRERSAIEINNSPEKRNAWAKRWYDALNSTPIDPDILAEAQDFVDRKVEPYKGMFGYTPGPFERFTFTNDDWFPKSPQEILMVMFFLNNHVLRVSSPTLDHADLPVLDTERLSMQKVLENMQTASQDDFAVPHVGTT